MEIEAGSGRSKNQISRLRRYRYGGWAGTVESSGSFHLNSTQSSEREIRAVRKKVMKGAKWIYYEHEVDETAWQKERGSVCEPTPLLYELDGVSRRLRID